MDRARKGDTVSVHYTGRLEDGTVFDTTAGRDPLVFTMGNEETIPGFEEAVSGMKPGELKRVRVPAKKAYGPRREEMLMRLKRDQLPEELEPQIGERLQLNQQDGFAMVVTITDIAGSCVTVDANHPLAGKDLVFDIRLVKVV